MNNKENYVAYEYKTVNAKRDSVGMYIDCMENFGWTLIENDGYDVPSLLSDLNPTNLGRNIASAAQTFGETADATPSMVLKFKRDRRIGNKQELEKLEKEYEAALTAISKAERKNVAQTMGISLGTGIIGTVFIGLAVYNFVFSHTVLGVLFAAIGAIGWAIGFFSNMKIGKKKTTESEPYIQQQLDIVYSTCEKAHALLA